MTTGLVALFNISIELLFIYVTFLIINQIPFEHIVKNAKFVPILKLFLAIGLGFLVSSFLITFIQQVQDLHGIVQ
ncbi:DUF1146 family protein [Periweissella beninensis]|uniref:DUF1146 family protein n=1 Tax=Periweissella beninensis TaxID=504936 RepID=A0ABT0VG31_9LACO|nr:DUF1146 family protein [Periweissella beninensis]MBM7543672.1 putative integral membrane protein (TIGR02327 family) [Periweissella beninensis]MCM2436651.1 DUF1146 family protein [Periweissella beninensis]MCT4395621.1 DUF1146 domain-containing protein [Periweissella beninensis]